MSRYPRIIHIKRLRHHKDSRVPCAHCGGKTEYIVTIAETIFRGDDDTYHLCKEAKLLCDEEEFDQLFTAMNSQRSKDADTAPKD